MKTNILVGIITLIFVAIIGLNLATVLMWFIGLLWIIAPIIAWYISLEYIEQNKYEQLNNDEKKYVLNLGEKTWNYFKDLQ